VWAHLDLGSSSSIKQQREQVGKGEVGLWGGWSLTTLLYISSPL
jgi:hypothetical protein